MGPDGIWLSFFISNVVGAIIAYVWFQRGTWRGADVRGPQVGDVAEEPATD
jgi:Na+-driven multidrug efflux pump